MKRISMIYFYLFVSILSCKCVSNHFIGTSLSRILNHLHGLAADFSGNNGIADRLIRKIVKTIIKLRIVHKDRNMLNQDDIEALMNFYKHFKKFIENTFELHDSDHTLNQFLFKRNGNECQQLIHMIIKSHLTRKSHERIDFIFSFILNEEFIKYVFDSNTAFNHAITKEIIVDLRTLINNWTIQN